MVGFAQLRRAQLRLQTGTEGSMRLSLFYQIQVPKPWTAESEAQRIYEALEQIPFAEQQGFSAVWFSEHHFRPVWSHNSAPDLTLAAVSQRTERMWQEFADVLPRIWTQEEITYEGEYFKIPRREVLPKPLQKPHPPLWSACGSYETAVQTGNIAMGGLLGSEGGPDRVRHLMAI